jgi:hypothetical protein
MANKSNDDVIELELGSLEEWQESDGSEDFDVGPDTKAFPEN